MFAINYLAVAAAAIASMVIGMAWFGFFGKAWMESAGQSAKDMAKKMKGSGMMMAYLTQFICSLVTALVISLMLHAFGAFTPISGALVGFIAWVGFVATEEAGSVLWEGKTGKIYLIKIGNALLTYVVMGAIIGAMA